MRAIGLVSLGLMMGTLPVTDAAAASNAWCAVYNRQGGTSENCGYATLNQCRARRSGRAAPGRLVRRPKGAAGTRRRAARAQSKLADRRRALVVISPSR
jgi:Protein of unknown function (DUF3551)